MPDSHDQTIPWRRPGSIGGVILVAAGVVGLVLGMTLIQSLTKEFKVSLEVTRSALQTVGDTVDMIGEVNGGAGATLDSASIAARSAAGATRDAVGGLEGLATFLEDELPGEIEAISRALPGAIDAADAVDTTLNALSLIGVNYAPDEPFGESLRRVERSLAGLPEQVRAQGTTLTEVVPTAQMMADDVEALADDIEELGSDLGGVDGLAESYGRTLTEADAAIADADSSLGRTVLFLRITVILAALAAIVAGLALIDVERRLSALSALLTDERHTGRRVILVDER